MYYYELDSTNLFHSGQSVAEFAKFGSSSLKLRMRGNNMNFGHIWLNLILAMLFFYDFSVNLQEDC